IGGGFSKNSNLYKNLMSKNQRFSLISFAFSLLLFTILIGTASAETWFVDDNDNDADFIRIQDAIDNASDGDMFVVRDGNYDENIDVNKRLTIRSENGAANTIVQATDLNDHVFNLTSNYVYISGFTVTGATEQNKAGIYLGSGVNECNVYENNVIDNHDGIRLSSSSNNKLTNNTANSNDEYGIYLSSSSKNTLTNNIALKNLYYSILLDSSSGNIITGNLSDRDHKGFEEISMIVILLLILAYFSTKNEKLKDLLKPDLRKIVLSIILFFVGGPIFFLGNFFETSTLFSYPILNLLNIDLGVHISIPIKYMIRSILFYLICCLLFYSYDKNKEMQKGIANRPKTTTEIVLELLKPDWRKILIFLVFLWAYPFAMFVIAMFMYHIKLNTLIIFLILLYFLSCAIVHGYDMAKNTEEEMTKKKQMKNPQRYS
ncbi:MAG: NosD domain-containing protein, partial [Halobacteriota archaeon]|nr:NosD domain-containing protein [Halobacteriota archaeon]